ncbi:MarR family winged helix-turn-helix transcriptional regulator [Streptomyces sp. ME19-01-6]|uniref:MarR family winged helix-turn-helix transcriptional regulator n=1 Tax=Streptomyces sp. ME19-01-6 TaxID=3028686 RepID=UPI0029A2366E|nr:MarR family winged helix-turn-helix transcriptional regulator [Streptomyces sp. ME19-01-6]MDX3227867.1 MarR family winged helix-turn-helix transcriptional regulator [Streptomyces sp. ME19-01-6]
MAREDLLAQLRSESRRYLASYILFNQAVADHLRMHPTDLQCLNLLTLEDGPVTTGRIAELTGLTSGSATRLVDRLEKAGQVTRRRDERDRRRVLVEVVPGALERFGAVWRELGAGWEELFHEDSEADLAVLLRHMRRTTELGRHQMARLAERSAAD